jgi:hypothetical protein
MITGANPSVRIGDKANPAPLLPADTSSFQKVVVSASSSDDDPKALQRKLETESDDGVDVAAIDDAIDEEEEKA